MIFFSFSCWTSFPFFFFFHLHCFHLHFHYRLKHLHVTSVNVIKVSAESGAKKGTSCCTGCVFWPLCPDTIQGCALAEPSGPWCLTFALGQLENLAFFTQIICWASRISQAQSTGLPSVFLRAQPCNTASLELVVRVKTISIPIVTRVKFQYNFQKKKRKRKEHSVP